MENEYADQFDRIIKEAFSRTKSKARDDELEIIKIFGVINGLIEKRVEVIERKVEVKEVEKRVEVREIKPCKIEIEVESEGIKKRFVILASELEIGKNKETGEVEIRYQEGKIGIGIHDWTVSKKHVKISVEDGGIIIEDLGSKNGTWVKGRKIIGDRVKANEFEIGYPRIKFRIKLL